MKGLKKALALILAVCMLIGMPLSIDVSAADDADAPVITAIVMPDSVADELGVEHDKGILLHFNKAVTIDPSKQRVTFGFVHATKGTADAGYGGNSILNVTTTIKQSGSIYYVDLAEFTHATVKTVSDLFAGYNDWTASYKWAFEVVARIVEKQSGPDNKLNGITYGDDNVAWPGSAKDYTSCQANCNINTGNTAGNTLDYLDIPIKTIADMPTLTSAQWTDEDEVEVTFSQAITMVADGFYAGMRIVNSKNETVIYRPNADVKYATEAVDGAERLEAAVALTDNSDKTTATVTEKSTVAIEGFAAGSVKTYSWFKAHLDACQAENPDDTFQIVFAIEDADLENCYIDGLVSVDAGYPMPATASMNKVIIKTTSFADPLVLEDIKILDSYWVEMTFSEDVTFNGSASFGLAIVLDGAIKERVWQGSWSWNGQSCGNTFNKTWRLKLASDGQAFIVEKYINQYKAQGAKLCFYFREAVSKVDGLIDSVYNKKGKQLTNTWEAMKDVRDLETMIVPVEDKVFLEPTAYVANDTFIAVSYNGQYGSGWQSNAYLAAYDAQGNMLQVGGNAAKWKLTVQQNYKNSANTTMNCAFSVPAGMTYNDIVAQLDAANFEGGYELKMIVEDTGAKNGVLDNFRGYNVSTNVAGLYVRADELCSTDTKDVAVIPFGEIVTIDNVKVDEKGQLLVTFSHDIDVDYFLSKLTNYSDFFLTISEKGANSFVKKPDGNPLAQTPVGSFKKVSDNQIVGYVNPTKYNDMMEVFNAKAETDNWAIRMRIEMPTGWNSATGELPLHKEIIALDDAVLSPFITMRNESRLWTDVESCAELQTIEVKDWMATITGQNSFTFEWTKPVTLGTGYRGIRYVDENGRLLYYNPDTDTVSTATTGTALQWAFVMEYADDTKTKINARLNGDGRLSVYSLADLIDPAADSEWGKIKAKHDGTFKVCLEEASNNMQGFIDTFQGIDGTLIMPHPLLSGNDGVYFDITGELIRGKVNVVSVKAVSDAVIEVTFSGPVEFLSNPYTALRFFKDSTLMYYNTLTKEFTAATKQVDADGKPVYKDADGNPTSESTSPDGSVSYAQIDNIPMQWAANRLIISEDKTVVRYSVADRAGAPVNGITELLTYDWEAEGGKIYFAYEESGADARTHDQHVNNIISADDPRIALEGNFFPHAYDGFRCEVEMTYTRTEITAKATVISDTQIRVDFSQPVNVDPNTYMAIRMLNKDNNLMWSGKENVSVAYQWPGSWKYANDAKTAIVWTIDPGRSIWGAKNVYDLLNWSGPLVRYKAEGTFCFVMEEKNTAANPTGRLNRLVETIASFDGTNHLTGNGGTGYDNLFLPLNAKPVSGEELKLVSVTAVDEHTMKVKFNREVLFKEGDEQVSMAIRYLTESGDSETLTDGKTAIFKGDWKYDGDDKSTIIWTLNSSHTDSLTEILTYSGKFKWNSSARCAFVISDQNADYYCPYRSMRINGITDLNGVHHLVANYSTDDQMMTQMDITVGYELPAVTIEPEQKIEYYTDYMTYIIVAAGLALAFVVVAVIVAVSKKKAR